jgi:hypothetical protein
MKIIVSIAKPAKNTKEEQVWHGILGEINSEIKNGRYQGTEKLGEGSWQILSDSGLPTLGHVIQSCEAERLSYQVVFVEAGTEWKRSF